MPDDGDAPGTSKQPLPGQTTHVGHVGVVDRETKHPGDTQDNYQNFRIAITTGFTDRICVHRQETWLFLHRIYTGVDVIAEQIKGKE